MDALSKDELRAVLSVSRAKRERDWLMWAVQFWHGARISEVIGIRADDVKDGFLTLERKKGSLRTVQALIVHADPLFSERDALMKLAGDTPFNQRLFPITRQHAWHLFRGYCKTAGIPEHKSHPHVLKHTIAMHMIETAGIHKTRQRLGHKSISSTGEYLKEHDADVDAVIVDAVEL